MYNPAFRIQELKSLFIKVTSAKYFYENRIIESINLIESSSKFTVNLDCKHPEKSYYRYKRNGKNITNEIAFDTSDFLFYFDNAFHRDRIISDMIKHVVSNYNEGDFLFKHDLPVLGHTTIHASCLGNYPSSSDDYSKAGNTDNLTIIFTLKDKKTSDNQIIECLKIIFSLTKPTDYKIDDFEILHHHFKYITGFPLDCKSKSFDDFISVLEMMQI